MEPEFQRVPSGSYVKFNCNSELPVTWYFNNSWLPSHAEEIGTSFYIHPVQQEDSGKYTCLGRVELGFQFLAVGHLEVEGIVSLTY